jgi:hypothetical protein
LQNYKKSGETPKFHPIYFFSFTLATFKNGKIEKLKNGNSDPGALKAQLHIAQGATLGHATSPSISAP